MEGSSQSKTLDDHLSEWVAKKKELGVPESKLFLPFLSGAPKLAECRACENAIYPGEEVSCSIKRCKVSYHLKCASDHFGLLQSPKEFKCPQHACFRCKRPSYLWRCSRCDLASHEKCAAYPEFVLPSDERTWEIICWRHSADSQLKPAEVPAKSIEEVFSHLPVPYVEEEFIIDQMWIDNMVNNMEPPSNVHHAVSAASIEEAFRRLPLPDVIEEFNIDLMRKDAKKNLKPPSYVRIKRNIYLTKKERYNVDDRNEGCTGCGHDGCYKDCICRYLHISCSIYCKCSEKCTNRPFQEKKKVKVVMTQQCGWGVEAAEFIKKGDFIIEYVGEVINDDLCKKRFGDLNQQGITKFFLVEVRKDFNIDATFKGNESRFVNHSCDPNCSMEKWDVNGETRVGIFATKSIKPGEQLTFNYRFEKFGTEVECHCGASNCHGYFGTKKLVVADWGAKRRRLGHR